MKLVRDTIDKTLACIFCGVACRRFPQTVANRYRIGTHDAGSQFAAPPPARLSTTYDHRACDNDKP